MDRFKNGDRVCFVGDSITAQNRYVAYLVDHYKTNFPNEDIQIFNCGISGGTSSLLLKYFDEDTLPHNPTHIFIMLGVNDSQRENLYRERSESRFDDLMDAYNLYKEKLPALIKKAQGTGARVTVMTPPPYDEYTPTDIKAYPGGFALVAGYANFVREYCKENSIELIDIHAYLTNLVQTNDLYNTDHTHPNDLGHHYIAKCILEKQGLDIGEYKDYPEYLLPWKNLVAEYREIYAVEYMVVKSDTMTVKEKVEFIRDYLDNKKYDRIDRSESLNEFFKRVSEQYYVNKPRQKEMFDEIDTIYKNTIAK